MFRIGLYLNFYKFLLGIFSFKKSLKINKLIKKEIADQSKKKYVVLSSQCRTGFLQILEFLKKNKKKEIIFSSYNLPEMINVAKNLGYKIKFCDLDYKTGFIDLKKIKKIINKNTAIIVMTNMFNYYSVSKKLKKIAKKFQIILIEDNAIYFDNFLRQKSKKIFSGNLGDYTIYSFNIMKNISALYGGAVSTNDKKFIEYYKKKQKVLKNFSKMILLNQIYIFLILKLISLKIVYEFIFFYIIKLAHQKNIRALLKIFYPSLKFKIISFPRNYFTKISSLSSRLIYLQLKDKKERQYNFLKRRSKNIYYYNHLRKIKSKGNISFIKINDINYQNFIDFPILVKHKRKLNQFLLNKGIETRYLYYNNCENIFNQKQKKTCFNAEKYEKELICLPNHRKISFKYMDYIIKSIETFCSKKNLND